MALTAADSIQPAKQSVLVIGLGLTGYSVIKFLSAGNCEISAADSRDLPPYLGRVKQEFPGVHLIMGGIPFDKLENFGEIIISPGVDLSPDETPPCAVIGDIELFARNADAPVIAITGSNGKSTVTMLVTEMLRAGGLKAKAGGNIGTPALELLQGERPDFYVLELSSFQLENTYSLRPVSAVILNVSEDHMDRYDTLDDYVEAKLRIFRNGGICIGNRDDPLTWRKLNKDPGIFSFGLDVPRREKEFGVIETDSGRQLARGDKAIAEVGRLHLQGDQNISNILAAFALVVSAGAPLNKQMINAALNYGGLPHRCEVVKETNNVKWINDSKGTNVGATIAAIKGFSRRIILILGGKGKGADFSLLEKVLPERVGHTIVYGEDAEIIISSLKSIKELYRAGSLDEAVIRAHELSRPDDIVLFSPACASFDMFDNYEHRGDVFKKLVLEMVH